MGSPALDLQDVDPRIWRVRAGEAVYGPYTLGQMHQFVAEGRIASHTSIAEGAGAFADAGDTPALRGAFRILAEQQAPAAPATPKSGGAHEPMVETEPAPTNMLVVLRTVAAPQAIMSVLSGLGPFVEAHPGTILLRTPSRIAKVRAALATVTEPGDQAVIVDAGANRIAWLGLQPETDTALRALWEQRQD
ncbi:MAG: hypothetical protein AAF253_09555 [Pseudomonadota bacterium]